MDTGVDVTFLRERCQNDTVIVLADAARRDRVKFPDPAEFAVHLVDPIKLVYGFDILDATIPMSVYNVDAGGNTLAYCAIADPQGLLSSDPRLVAQLNDESAAPDAPFARTLARLQPGETLWVVRHDRLLDAVRAVVPGASAADVRDWALRACERLADEVPAAEAALQELLPPPATTAGAPVAMGPLALSATRSPPAQHVAVFASVRRRLLKLSVPASLVPASAPSASGVPALTLQGHDSTFEPGFYDAEQFVGRLNFPDALNPGIEDWADRAVRHPDLQAEAGKITAKLTLRHRRGARFAINLCRTTLAERMGYASPPSPTGLLLSSASGVFTPARGILTFKHTAHVVLRCHEIEENVYREDVDGASGLGIFKLYDTNDVAHLRFDFVNFVRRPFHPISQLSRLTFRLENVDGSLCRFNGVPSLIVLGVKRYMPLPPGDFGKAYVLNPNYDPDFRRYAIREMELRQRFERPPEPRLPDVAEFVREHNAYARDPRRRPPDAQDVEDHSSDDDVDEDVTDDDEEGGSALASSVWARNRAFLPHDFFG